MTGKSSPPLTVHQAMIVNGDLDAVGRLRWQHPFDAPRFGSGFFVKNNYPRSRGHFLIA